MDLVTKVGVPTAATPEEPEGTGRAKPRGSTVEHRTRRRVLDRAAVTFANIQRRH